jgi:hypothetical protein
MGIVMIKCPQTGREIPTGIKADPEKFRCSVVFFARTFCSLCKAHHEWFAKDAWVRDAWVEEAWVCEPGEMADINGLLAAG